MKRIKAAFDPHGILNPGKIFPDEVAASRIPEA
jgi:FAD/FMN-containing dehydrogenase